MLIKFNVKSAERLIPMVNFISRYYYELSNGVKVPINDDTLQGFKESEAEFIKSFIKYAETKQYPVQLILKEINSKIYEFYSKNIDLNLENAKSILSTWRSTSFQNSTQETEFLKDSINKKIETQIAFINIDNKSYQEKLQTLVENVNPYSALSVREIKLIDNDFFQKNSLLNKINQGNDYFKKSRLKESFDCYEDVIKMLSEEKEIENLHLYFFAWALHQVGNIYYVLGDFEKAVSYYNNSFSIKTKIEELPKLLLFSTQLKIFGLLSYFPENHKNWSINLESFITKITDYQLRNENENQLFINNLICDANFYLFNGYTLLGDKPKSDKYFNIAIGIAKENKDLPGIIKIYFTKYLSGYSEKHFNALTVALKEATEIQKVDPYITAIFKNAKISASKRKIAAISKVKKVFADNNVKLIG